MARTDFAQARKIATRRHQHASRTGDRFDNHGRNVLRAMFAKESFQIVGELSTVSGLAVRKGVARQILRVAQVCGVRQQRALPGVAILGNATHRHATEPHAVIGAVPANEQIALRVATQTAVGERNFKRRIDRFGTGVGEEHLIETTRRMGREARGQLKGQGVTHVESGCKIHGLKLPRDRITNLNAAVAGIDAPQPGSTIQDPATVIGLVIHARRACQQARRGAKLPIRRKGHPEGGKLGTHSPQG